MKSSEHCFIPLKLKQPDIKDRFIQKCDIKKLFACKENVNYLINGVLYLTHDYEFLRKHKGSPPDKDIVKKNVIDLVIETQRDFFIKRPSVIQSLSESNKKFIYTLSLELIHKPKQYTYNKNYLPMDMYLDKYDPSDIFRNNPANKGISLKVPDISQDIYTNRPEWNKYLSKAYKNSGQSFFGFHRRESLLYKHNVEKDISESLPFNGQGDYAVIQPSSFNLCALRKKIRKKGKRYNNKTKQCHPCFYN